MAPDVLERLRATDPARRMPGPKPDDRERLRRAIVATAPKPMPATRRWWRRGRSLAVVVAGVLLVGSGAVYAERLITGGQKTSYTVPSGTWQRLPLTVDGGEIVDLAIDPKNTAVLYAATAEGLFKSNDGAATWNRLRAGRDASSITVHPEDPSHLFAFARAEPDTSGLVESHDGGASWSTVSACPAVGYLGGLWIDRSTTPQTLYAAGLSPTGFVGVFVRSRDNGRTWSQIGTGVKGFRFPFEVAIDPSTHMVYALGSSGLRSVLVRSSDGGITWRDMSARLPVRMRAWIEDLRVDPSDTSRLYLHAPGRQVFASSDSGQTWFELDGEARDWAMAVVNAPPGTPASAVHAASRFLVPFERLAATHRLTDAATGLPLDSVGSPVVVDSQEPSTLYVGTAQGVYKSTDTGATWCRASEGITSHDVFDVLLDRRSPSTLLALTPAGLVRSSDGGSTSVMLLPAAVTSVVAAPSSPSTLYAAIDSGVLKSTDGGETWSRLRHKGLPTDASEMRVVLVASDRPDTVYVVADGVIFRSTDGARTCSRVRGVSSIGVQLAELPGDPSTLFATHYEYGRSAPGHAGRLFQSVDRGRTWTRIGGASWGAGPVAFAIDPWTPSQMLVATEATHPVWHRSVWHRSTDGGKTWHHFTTLRAPGAYCEYLVFDPWVRDTVYAVTAWAERHDDVYPAVYRSKDGGATWDDVSDGLPHYWLEGWPKLVVAPGGVLYTATESGLYKWVPRDR